MILRTLTYLILTIFSTNACYSQDIHFSQFKLSPLNLNPSLTGVYDGDYRFTANHRNQWSSVTIPYSTFAFSFEKNKLLKKPISIGFQINQDRAGDSKLNTFQFNPSLSYQFKIDSTHIISSGIQMGFTKRNLDYNPLSFDAQYNGSIYDPTLPNQENFSTNSNNYLNINFGISHLIKINANLKFNSGISIYNLNGSKQSYFNDATIRLDPRITIHSNCKWKFAENMIFNPSFLWLKQGKHQEFIISVNSEYILEKFMKTYRSIYGGLAYRNKDAIFINAGYKFDNWQLGISYDLNLSKLVPASIYRGGFEIAIIYIIDNTPANKIIHRICPDYL
jgi:type IX secretion system PorP/SprF family membrane protein